jgi:hypothetical protein
MDFVVDVFPDLLAWREVAFDILDVVSACQDLQWSVVAATRPFTVTEVRSIKRPLPDVVGFIDEHQLGLCLESERREMWVLKYSSEFTAGVLSEDRLRLMQLTHAGPAICLMATVALDCDDAGFVNSAAFLHDLRIVRAFVERGSFRGSIPCNPIIWPRYAPDSAFALLCKYEREFRHCWLNLLLEDGSFVRLDPCAAAVCGKPRDGGHWIYTYSPEEDTDFPCTAHQCYTPYGAAIDLEEWRNMMLGI